MAVVALIRNSKGEIVVDFSRTMYRVASGVLKSSTEIVNEARAACNAIPGVSPYGRSQDEFVRYGRWPWVASPGGAGMAAPGNSSQGIELVAPAGRIGDLVFLRPDEIGFRQSVASNTELPGLPSGMYLAVNSAASLSYTVVSPQMPPFVPDGSAGLRIRDDAGAVTFDSRYPQMSIFTSYLLTAAAAEDILVNGTTVNITLPKPAHGAWVCAPYHMNEWHSKNPTAQAYVGLRQINDTTIQLFRDATPGFDPAPGRTLKSFIQDSFFLIGRNIG